MKLCNVWHSIPVFPPVVASYISRSVVRSLSWPVFPSDYYHHLTRITSRTTLGPIILKRHAGSGLNPECPGSAVDTWKASERPWWILLVDQSGYYNKLSSSLLARRRLQSSAGQSDSSSFLFSQLCETISNYIDIDILSSVESFSQTESERVCFQPTNHRSNQSTAECCSNYPL